jgi:glutathione S-transferase
MYALYYAPGAASLAVHWMLIELGAAHELRKVDLEKGDHKRGDYLRLNPNGRVPTLIVDGAPQWETAALLMLLAERHPAARLAITPGEAGRADYLQWMLHLADTLQPAFRSWFYPAEAAGAGALDAAKTAAKARIEAEWALIDAHLADARPHFLGARLTAVDFFATMLMRWSRNMPRPARDWTHVAAYERRMKATPSLREVHRREGLTDWIGA